MAIPVPGARWTTPIPRARAPRAAARSAASRPPVLLGCAWRAVRVGRAAGLSFSYVDEPGVHGRLGSPPGCRPFVGELSVVDRACIRWQ